MMKPIIIAFFILNCLLAFSQKKVAITIDDAPNTREYQENGFRSKLMEKLDSLKIPIALFINEKNIFLTDSVNKNFELLNAWIKKDYITAGNHTFSHPMYSKVGFRYFSEDIVKGGYTIKELAKKYGKEVTYIRMPYNDLGSDSLQHDSLVRFLKETHYTIAPFTIESDDWVYNDLYLYYLDKNQKKDAERIANTYLDYTVSLFNYFDSLSQAQYGRPINQIYLCHDSKINADYLSILLNRLKSMHYSFISLDDATKDKAYQQPDTYYKKWGISWVYRWMGKKYGSDSWKLLKEPSAGNLYKEYQALPDQYK